MNEFFISRWSERLEIVLIAVFFVGVICVVIYNIKSPAFHRGNPFVEGGIKNPRTRLIVLSIAAIIFIINVLVKIIDLIGD